MGVATTISNAAPASEAIQLGRMRLAGLIAVGAAIVWSYWTTLVELREFWSRNEDYSVGQLVPIVAAYLVWRDRAWLRTVRMRPCWWAALGLVVVELLRLGGLYFGYGSADRYALVLTIGLATMLAAGWGVFHRLRWVWLFLFLMVPLPARIHEMVSLPLQELATGLAAFSLEVLGFFVAREGNVLRLSPTAVVAVAEACSGLRMLTAFIFVAVVLAFVLERPAWQRATLIIASVPIAVVCNAIRVVATALIVYYSNDERVVTMFHDVAGFAMMPLALVISIGLLAFLGRLTRPDQPGPGNPPRPQRSVAPAARPNV